MRLRLKCSGVCPTQGSTKRGAAAQVVRSDHGQAERGRLNQEHEQDVQVRAARQLRH